MKKKLKLKDYMKIEREAFEELLDIIKKKGKRVIIDTHAVILLDKYGYLPGFSYEELKKLNPRGLVLLTASAYDIYSRRYRDYLINKRKRELNLDKIKEELKLEEMYAHMFSTQLGVPLKVIKNPEGQILKTAEEFLEFIKEAEAL